YIMIKGAFNIKYVFLTIVFVVVSCLSGLTAQNTDENYIKATKYKIETTQSLPNPKVDEAFEQITYYDGLGNPKQVILYRQSASGNDIITPIYYDGLGRQAREYLPYTDGAQSLDLRIDPLTD